LLIALFVLLFIRLSRYFLSIILFFKTFIVSFITICDSFKLFSEALAVSVNSHSLQWTAGLTQRRKDAKRVASYGFKATSYRLQATGILHMAFNIHHSSFEVWVAGGWTLV